MLGEKVVCATVSPHLYIHTYIQGQCHLPLQPLCSDFGDFGNGVCHVMNLATAESDADMELLTQHEHQPQCADNKMPIRTTSVTSHGFFFFLKIVISPDM